MGLNIVDVQDAILEHLKDTVPQHVEEGAIPEASTVRKVNGAVEPYIVVQFGDPIERAGGRTFVGVRTSDYDVPIYVQAVAPDAGVARRIAYDNVYDALLGFQMEGTAELRQRRGGALWTINGSNGATEAYMAPTSFSVVVQMVEK